MVINGGLLGRVPKLRSKGMWQCDLNQNTCSSREEMLRLSMYRNRYIGVSYSLMVEHIQQEETTLSTVIVVTMTNLVENRMAVRICLRQQRNIVNQACFVFSFFFIYSSNIN